MIRATRFSGWRGVILSLGLLVMATLSMPAPTLSQAPRGSGNTSSSQGTRSQQVPTMPTEVDLSDFDPATTTARLTDRQKQHIMKANFEKSKSDAAELAAIAKELREEINKPDVNLLSAEVITRAERIEKLAKKIREETKGF